MFLKSHDPCYWSARALDAQNRAERCRGDDARRSLLIGLAEDYSWIADRVRPRMPASNVGWGVCCRKDRDTDASRKHTRNKRCYPQNGDRL